LSVGCVFYQPQRGDIVDVNWLIEQADQAMYRAKNNGGDSMAIEHFHGTEVMTV
jgi:GGDEF domain-containing protein